MDLSIKKIKENNLKFKGMKGTYHADNTPVYKFIAPPFDRKNERAVLQIVILAQNKDTKQYITPQYKDIMEINFNSDEPLELSQENLRELSKGFAYRYKIVNEKAKTARYITDESKTIKLNDGTRMNLIEQNNNYIISPKTGTMRHSFIDSDAVLTPEGTLKNIDPNFVRNHFNKLGGSIKGLTYLLKNTDELDSYRYIISTPDIGNDPISSHKYWPNNQFQCTNIEDFKEFIFELYKRGKGYVADGAFTSQGIQSPIVHHVLKWGKQSPFYNMLKIDDIPKLGILPDRSYDDEINPFDYIGVRIVNSPQQKNYNRHKATYIQFFDKRLSSEKQQNSDELIKAYDKKPNDHYEIVSHQDSIIPYYFEISPDDKEKLKAFKGQKAVLLSDITDLNDFLTFPNYIITTKAKASGANYWDGNRDIIKMNLSNPTNEKANIEGFFNARNYLYKVASFWSETIQSDLILKTALMSDSEKFDTAKQNDISQKMYEEIKSSISSMRSPILDENKTVRTYIEEFPLQSIETDPDLSAIFAQPEFNQEFLSKGTLETLETIIQNTINEAIPDEYKQNNEYRTYVTKLYTPTIIKNILIAAMCPQAINENGTINLDALKNISLASMNATNESTVEEERATVIRKIRKGINSANVLKIKQKMQSELKNINLEDFKLAENIVIQGKAGLNWRFDAAKDIGDLDSTRDGNTSMQSIWEGDKNIPGVEDFWINFVSNVKKYNPSAYVIAEITDLWSFANKKNNMPEKLFDKRLAKAKESLSYGEQNEHSNQLPYIKEIEFINKIGATTSSNYDAYFNNLSAYLGVDPENGTNRSLDAGNIIQLKNKMEEFVSNNQPNYAILSHMFTDNHDKPRLLHTLPLDMELFSKLNMQNATDNQKEIAKNLTGRTDFINISAKAIAVGMVMQQTIDKLYKNNFTKKEALLNSLRNLINGKTNYSSRPNFKRAEAFGNAPYEISIRDLFKNAGFENEDEIWNFHYTILANSMKLQEGLWEVMNALMGTPTIYYGTEYAQTGYETSSKNVYVQNRNQTLRNLKEREGYRQYYTKMNAISSLYKQNGLSAIRDGFGISLKYLSSIDGIHPGAILYYREKINEYAQAKNISFDEVIKLIKTKMKDEKEYKEFLSKDLQINDINGNHDIIRKIIDKLNPFNPSGKENLDLWPIFKYDDKGSRVISVITNNGVSRRENSNNARDFQRQYTLGGIPIKDSANQCPLEEGTKLKRKIFVGQKYIDDNKTYVVKNQTIISEDGSPIDIRETVENFYVPMEYNKQTKYMASLYNLK